MSSLDVSVLSEEEELLLERAAAAREREWLLSSEVPFVCGELRRVLERCVEIIAKKGGRPTRQTKQDVESGTTDTESVEDFFQDSQLLSFESPEGTLRGSVRLEGWNIALAELVVQSSKWNKGAAFKTSILSGHPFKLAQIHHCSNHLRACLSTVEELEALSNGGGLLATADNVHKVVKHLGGLLRVAMHELLLPHTENLFPLNVFSTIHSTQPLIFQPPLPQDLILELGVSDRKLVISTYCLNITTQAPKVPTYNATTTIAGQIYKCFGPNGQYWAELMDQGRVHCSAGVLDTAFSKINFASKLCAELQEKVAIFLS